jgi:TRAP-type mannitol/chloroaromatic compound transport system permease small subunit
MERVAKILDSLNEVVGKGVSYLILVMIFIIMYEATSRYFFDEPTAWGYDVSGWLQVVYVFLGGGFALKRGFFVRVDILYVKFSPRVKAILDLTLTTVLMGLFVYVLLWKGGAVALSSIRMGEISSTGVWNGPVYPAKMAIPLGAALLATSWISYMLRAIQVLIPSRESP